MEPHNRKLLLQPDVTPDFRHPPPPPPPPLVPSSTSSSSYDYLPSEFLNIPRDPKDDSSTTATVVVILAVLLLFALFSIYMRGLGNQSRSLQRRSRPTQPSPAPPQRVELYVIKSLPVFSFRENAKYQSDCAICLGEYEENERVKLIPFCQHAYHPHCIDTWLSSQVSCPICRSTRFFKYDERGDRGGK